MAWVTRLDEAGPDFRRMTEDQAPPYGQNMLIAEELLLQLTTPAGKLIAGSNADIGLAGALLTELALLGKVTVTEKQRLATLDRAPTGDQILDDALALFVDKEGKKPKDVLGKVAKKLRGRLYGRLAVEGLVREEQRKILGLFPKTDWPLVNDAARAHTHRQMTEVLLGRAPADPRTAALISLIHAVDAVPRVFDRVAPEMSGRELKKLAKGIAEGNWASDAVSRSIAQAQAAVNAAVIATVVAGASAGADGGGG